MCVKGLLIYLKQDRKECVLGPLFKLLEALFELFVPLVMTSIIDVGIATGSRRYILERCGLLVLLAVVGLVCSITAQYFAARAATGFSARLRIALFAHLQGLSYREIDTLGSATMITRMTSDVNQLQNGVNLALRLLLRSPFVVFGAMVMAFTIDVPGATVFAVAIPVLLAVVFAIILVTIPMYRKVQNRLDGVTAATRENLTGVRVLRAFRKEQEEIAEFSRRNRLLNQLQLRVGRISNLLNPVTYVILNLAVVALLRTGALRVNSGALTQGQVVALYNYMSQILVELIKFANLIITMTKAVACGNRIQSVFAMQSSQTSGSRHPEETLRGQVEFRNAGITYGVAGAEALSGVSFLARSGQTVGIIGGTGSGKSTLVNLIPRFYDATQGQVLVDGVDVRELNLEADCRGSPEGGAVPGDHPFQSPLGPGGRHGGGASGGPHRGPGYGDCPGEGPGAGCGGPAGGRKSLRRPAPAPDHCPSPDPAAGDSDSGRQRLSPGLCYGCQAPGRHWRSAQSPYHLCGFAAGGVHSPCRLDSGTG